MHAATMMKKRAHGFEREWSWWYMGHFKGWKGKEKFSPHLTSSTRRYPVRSVPFVKDAFYFPSCICGSLTKISCSEVCGIMCESSV